MGCISSRDAYDDPSSPLTSQPVTPKSEVQASAVNDADVQPSVYAETVEKHNSAKTKAEEETKKADANREPTAVESNTAEVAADVKREPESNHDEVNLKIQPAQIPACENETESDSKKKLTEQKDEQRSTTTITKAIPDEVKQPKESTPVLVSTDADSADSDTDADGKDLGPPLLTLDGEHIRRHSDTSKKMFKQLAHLSKPRSRIAKKDFLQYFRNQGATHVTSRRLYSKFNPRNTPSMNFEEFQVNLIANTHRLTEK